MPPLFLAGVLGLSSDLVWENVNIPAYDELAHAGNYNRLRAELTLEPEALPDGLARLTVDNETFYQDQSDHLANDTLIYRAYLQYSGERHGLTIGRQRVPLGVGRIWNPVDIFNPVDNQAIERQERRGAEAVRYECAISRLSALDVSLAADKGAVRLKGYLDGADVAIVGLWDEDSNLDIIGWELEGELFDTGLELRGEGGSFHDRDSGERHTEFILGGEYGFADSFSILAEYHYSDKQAGDELAFLFSWQPAMLWNYSLLTVTSLKDGSGFAAPAVEYSLGDEMSLGGGVFLYHGNRGDGFAGLADRYYLRWFVHFK